MKLRRIAIGVVVALAVIYCGLLGWIYFNQRALEYGGGGKMFGLSETALKGATLVSIPSAEGSALAGWYEPPQAGKPLILYFRGNDESFSREHQRYEAMEADGYGFLAFDYRGFGGSPGQITQTHILEDALAAYDWVATKGFPIVIWGRSLGSGPATYTSGMRRTDALYLETPFDSAVSVAHDRYWFLPIDLLMEDKFPVDEWIAKATAPVFVAHGTGDHTISDSHGRRVYELAPNKAGLWIVPDADHDELWAHGEWDKAKAFFAKVETSLGR